MAALASLGAEGKPDFARDVRPILETKCFRCHGSRKQEAGLRLDVRQRALQGGDSGAVIKAGHSDKSELVRRISSDGDKRMPPSGAGLSVAEIAVLRAWIDGGAPWPDELAGAASTPEHWAFRPVRRPEPPQVRDRAWPRTAVDRFILARLEKEKIAPAAEANAHTLLRRLHLDLVGLPPSPQAIADFVEARNRDVAFEAAVDRLLASPHFGERWGRHWLDLVRFAESDGYENDNLRPDAFRYRDWVVRAFNSDMPYDRFTVEQLAGDLLPGATDEQRLATGMHRNTLHNSAASGDKEEFRTYAVRDRTDTTGTIWLGLTLGCAKCHSHKYDPISQREYYQLYAFFNGTDHHDVAVAGGKALTLKTAARPTHIHVRGNFLQKGDEVAPGVPAFLPPFETKNKAADRLDLARWLIDPSHPLPARVAVNHIWQHLFGRGLVATPDNFGSNGTPPTHPELLDWLASEFVRVGWSRKQLIRTIVLSAAYRQSARQRPELGERDPDNALVARQNRFRVEGEIVRDVALAASGQLDAKVGGPSIVPPFPSELPVGQLTNESLKRPTPERHRRSIYIHVQRTLVHPVLSTFDPADPNQPCVRRERSGTPMQALSLLNDPTFVECGRALGRRLLAERVTQDERLALGFLLCAGRGPSDAERKVLVALIDEQRRLGANEETLWTGVARTLLNAEMTTTRE